jgi:ferritin-like metal-binding protein YciE
MSLIQKATDFIFGIVLEDETVKNFPKEFVAESAKWIRSWFLKDDPKTEAKLTDSARNAENKKAVIETKLEDMLENATFKAALEQQLAQFEQQKARLKNVVTDADIDVKGNVHIGDNGSSSGDNYNEKNVIKGSTIKAGGDFRLGDDVVSGNQNVHIVHNYFGGKGNEKTPPQYSTIKSELKTLLAKEKTDEVIERLLDLTEAHDKDLNNIVLLLSARLNRINSQEHKGVISNGEAGIERNKINAALTSVIDEWTI